MQISLIHRLILFTCTVYMLLVVGGISAETTAPSTTIHICQTQLACDVNTLAVAVQNASAGDTIMVGNPQGNVSITGRNITIDKDLTIIGYGPVSTNLSPNSDPANEHPVAVATRRIFHVVNGANLTLSNLTLRNGNASMISSVPSGGAIRFEGSHLTLDTVSFYNNAANLNDHSGCGGAIFFAGDLLSISNAEFSHNTAYRGGAVCTIRDQAGPASRTTIKNNTTFSLNWASHQGGALYMVNTQAAIDDATFSFNQTTLDSSGGGGAIYVESGTFSISDSQLVNNSTIGQSTSGGAIYFNTDLDVESQLIHNTLFDDNEAGRGGALYLKEGPLRIVNSTLQNNSATNGGALYGGNNACVVGRKSGCQAGRDPNLVNLLLDRVSVLHNEAEDGGGLHLTNPHRVGIINSTVSGNNSLEHGGGIYVATALYLHNVTVAENTANANRSNSGYGGGIYVANLLFDPPSISNSIIADNHQLGLFLTPDGPDCYGSIASLGHNIIEDVGDRLVLAPGGGFTTEDACTGVVATDITGVDPVLEALTSTSANTLPIHALQPTSPAVNAGDPTGCVDHLGQPIRDDQRLYLRTDRCDIGAFELNATPTVVKLAATDVLSKNILLPIIMLAMSLSTLSLVAKRSFDRKRHLNACR